MILLAMFGVSPIELLILAAIALMVLGVPIVALVILVVWFRKQKTK